MREKRKKEDTFFNYKCQWYISYPANSALSSKYKIHVQIFSLFMLRSKGKGGQGRDETFTSGNKLIAHTKMV